MIRKLPEFENEPYPSMDNRRKGRLKIVSSEDGDVAGVFVMAFRIVNRGENPASRINVQYVIQEIPTRHKTVLCFVISFMLSISAVLCFSCSGKLFMVSMNAVLRFP